MLILSQTSIIDKILIAHIIFLFKMYMYYDYKQNTDGSYQEVFLPLQNLFLLCITYCSTVIQ